jgi:hypothetical protein
MDTNILKIKFKPKKCICSYFFNNLKYTKLKSGYDF